MQRPPPSAPTRPVAIIMTYGHFDHVGALEDLAREWDASVYPHQLELPYLNGRASYPPGDSSVGGAHGGDGAPVSPRTGKRRGTPASFARRRDAPGNAGLGQVHTPWPQRGPCILVAGDGSHMIVGDAFVTTAQESAYAVARQRSETLRSGPRRRVDRCRSAAGPVSWGVPHVVLRTAGRCRAAMRSRPRGPRDELHGPPAAGGPVGPELSTAALNVKGASHRLRRRPAAALDVEPPRPRSRLVRRRGKRPPPSPGPTGPPVSPTEVARWLTRRTARLRRRAGGVVGGLVDAVAAGARRGPRGRAAGARRQVRRAPDRAPDARPGGPAAARRARRPRRVPRTRRG